MIARKIVYHGNFNTDSVNEVFDITRKIDITGRIKANGGEEIELNLEGDPSMIKLIQHQIERKIEVKNKVVTPIPYQSYVGIILLK
jgi:hypothetical protein